MTTGIVVKPDPAAANAVDDAISQASGAFHRGVAQVWLNQRFDVDALTLAAVIATAVPGLGVGTAVVPINPRHPLLVASAAQTAQAAAHGNFSLGIGLGGNELEQRAFGIPHHRLTRTPYRCDATPAPLPSAATRSRETQEPSRSKGPVRVDPTTSPGGRRAGAPQHAENNNLVIYPCRYLGLHRVAVIMTLFPACRTRSCRRRGLFLLHDYSHRHHRDGRRSPVAG